MDTNIEKVKACFRYDIYPPSNPNGSGILNVDYWKHSIDFLLFILDIYDRTPNFPAMNPKLDTKKDKWPILWLKLQQFYNWSSSYNEQGQVLYHLHENQNGFKT